MNRKSKMILISFIIVALGAAAASFSIAAAKPALGWHMGTNWQQTSFSASGVVNTIDTTKLTMTVQLNGTSRLLSDQYDKLFTFALTANTRAAVLVNGGMDILA